MPPYPIPIACTPILTKSVIRGFINSFGVFQTYYVTALSRPPSDIAWIGSIQVFLLFFIGTFTGRLTDAGYFRQVFLVGSFMGGMLPLPFHFLHPLPSTRC